MKEKIVYTYPTSCLILSHVSFPLDGEDRQVMGCPKPLLEPVTRSVWTEGEE